MEPCHIGIHFKVLSESFQMNTNEVGFGEKLEFFLEMFFLDRNSAGGERVKLDHSKSHGI